MFKCLNLTTKQKKYKKFFYCKKYKKEICLNFCFSCNDFEIVRNKGIKKVSKKRICVTEETYQKVFERDKGCCRLCGTTLQLQLHHINGRGKDLTNDVNNCIILCRHCHLDVVHRNQKKYRPKLKEIIRNDIKI